MTEEVKYNEVFTSRAILDLHGFFIITSKMDIIDNPKIIFNGLRADELYLLDYIEKLDSIERMTIYEEIVRDNVIEIFSYPGQKIDINYSPAGVVNMVAEAVLQLTYDYLVNANDQKYLRAVNTVTYLDNMQAIVAHYLNIPFNTVCEMSINELYKKYAICAQTFPHQVSPLQRNEEGA